jgi:malate dehydrogenase
MLARGFVKASGLKPSRVMGLGCILDSTRLRFMIAKELNVSMENVSALVIGRHADPMIPLAKYCCVSGVPVSRFMEEERLLKLFEDTREAGGLIVDMAQRASSFYGPSAVAAELAEAVFRDSRRILSVSHVLTGQYGIEGVCLSLPAVIGREGIIRTLEPELSPSELKSLKASAEEVRV